MDHKQSIPTETVDQLLSLLANARYRDAITYMRAESADEFSVSDLANELSTQSDEGAGQVAIQLHHSILPKLADASVVDFDAQSNTVQFRGHSNLESLLDSLPTASP